jgi:hypothetical protein
VRAPAPAEATGMAAITVTLELDAAGDSFTGSARDATGARKDFSGWLGLISAVEELLAPTTTQGDAQ